MTTDHLQEICKEIQRGEKSLAASEKLFQAGLMEDAISRSYYAVLHAARAAILCIGLRPLNIKRIMKYSLNLKMEMSRWRTWRTI